MLTGVLAVAGAAGCSGSSSDASKGEDATTTESVEDAAEEESSEAPDSDAASEDEAAGEATASGDASVVSDDEIRPEVRQAIDSYEQFYDSYYDFLDSYDESDPTMLARYGELMSQTAQFESDWAALEGRDDLTTAESAYMLEVSGRVMQRAVQSMGNVG